MADLLHADAVQQLEVALIGSPAANVVSLLSAGLEQTKPFLQTTQPHPQTYTSTPPSPIPMAFPLLGLSTISIPGIKKMKKTAGSQDVPVITPKCSDTGYLFCFSSTIH